MSSSGSTAKVVISEEKPSSVKEKKQHDAFFDDDEDEMRAAERQQQPCPETQANFLSRLVFWWLNPLVSLGYKKVLEMGDMYQLREEERAQTLSENFHSKWNQTKQSSKPSVIWAIHKSFGPRFYLAAIPKFMYDICELVSPLFVRWIIQHIEKKDDPVYIGYIYAVAMLLLQLCSLLIIHQYFHIVMTQGMRLRSALRTAIYRKSLRLSNEARQSLNSGEIVTTMSVDCQKIGDLLTYLHMIWSAAFQIVFCLVSLFVLIRWSAIVGLIVMIVILPLNALFTRLLHKLRTQTLKLSGERIKVINEILQGIRVIKFYAWENSFLARVRSHRLAELAKIRLTAIVYVVSNVIGNLGPLAVIVFTFTVYSLLGNELNAAVIFPALTYFNLLRFPMQFLPAQFGNLAEAKVSLDRIQKYLLADEIQPKQSGNDEEFPIVIKNGEFTWKASTEQNERPMDKKAKGKKYAKLQEDEEKEKNVKVNIEESPAAESSASQKGSSSLRDINIQIPKGKLTCIVGQVGSGKSSLLQAIIGDMKQIKGDTVISGSVAYTAQQAWIQNASVKENILFGNPMNPQRYEETLHACCLEKDLDMLPAGDKTEIGEKGINLSGGQRQRVNLARAVYSDADIFLFDDPLSAVDAHVGKHIFYECMCGLLKLKTRVLVTHQWHFLKAADNIIVFDEGQVVEQGSYEQLIKAGGALSSMLKAYTHHDEEEEEESKIENTEETTKTEKKVTKKADAKLMQTEERATGSVKPKVYTDYIKYAGGWFLFLFTVAIFALTTVAGAVNSWWLAYWSDDSKTAGNKGLVFYLSIFTGLGGAVALLTFVRELLFTIFGMKASQNLHDKAMANIIRAPTSFYDTTPVGRIINRFSKDTEQIDSQLINIMKMFLGCVTGVAQIFIIVAYVTPAFLIPLIPIMLIYVRVQQFYRSTSREIQRLESISRSPIFAHFSETLTGLSTIRAYSEQDRFEREFFRKLDTNNKPAFAQLCLQRWLGVRLEFLGRMIVFISALFAVISRLNIPYLEFLQPGPGMAGLSLSYSLQVTGILNWAVRMFVDQENCMTAVERVLHYCDEVKQEAPAIIPENRPPEDWPHSGQIVFKDVVLKYRKELDPVLNGFTAMINGSDKIGIVGRTGAGKSSLMQALFRLVELDSGSIEIDSIDISKIGLEDLRSKLVIIPQDPVLFSGTIRFNLDPFDKYEDHQIWTALEQSHLKKKIESLPKKLYAPVAEYGENFSVGERQLICIARAVLRHTKVLVMDEATASVDPHVDNLIQRTIRSAFTDRTTITIAHRLNTIIDSDRIMVMEKGQLAEYDSPRKLLHKEEGLFTSLVRETGKTNERYLRRIADGEVNFAEELEKQIQGKEEASQ